MLWKRQSGGGRDLIDQGEQGPRQREGSGMTTSVECAESLRGGVQQWIWLSLRCLGDMSVMSSKQQMPCLELH